MIVYLLPHTVLFSTKPIHLYSMTEKKNSWSRARRLKVKVQLMGVEHAQFTVNEWYWTGSNPHPKGLLLPPVQKPKQQAVWASALNLRVAVSTPDACLVEWLGYWKVGGSPLPQKTWHYRDIICLILRAWQSVSDYPLEMKEHSCFVAKWLVPLFPEVHSLWVDRPTTVPEQFGTTWQVVALGHRGLPGPPATRNGMGCRAVLGMACRKWGTCHR